AVALESRHKLHVLTLTPFYPRNEDDTCGCFISEPLRLMPELGVSSTVISVHPVYRQDEYIARRGLRDGGYLPIPGNLGLSSAGSVICVSEHVKQCVLAGMKGTPVACRVAYNGVDPMRFSPGQGGDNSEPVILSVGNLHPIKGHELVVRAVAALKDTYSDLRY